MGGARSNLEPIFIPFRLSKKKAMEFIKAQDKYPTGIRQQWILTNVRTRERTYVL